MDLGDRNTLILLGAVVLVVVVVVGTVLLGRVGDVIQALTMTRKARRALHESGYDTVLADIDERIATMEANIAATKAEAARIAGMSRSASAPYEGVYNELRWLRKYREVVEREKAWAPR